jgi:hypothetical protein
MGSTLSSNRNNYKNQSISLPPKLRKIENRDQQMKKEKKNNRMNSMDRLNIMRDSRFIESETGEIFEGEDANILNRMADEMDRRKKKQEQEDEMQ